jgi:hypothetical protein
MKSLFHGVGEQHRKFMLHSRSSATSGTLRASRWRLVMLDAMFMAIGFGFLAGAVLYVVACDRL